MAKRSPKRRPGRLGLPVLALLQLGLAYICSGKVIHARSQLSRPTDAAPKVAVYNNVGFHNEVYCALIWSFQRAGAEVTAFVNTEATWQIEEVIQGWYLEPFRRSTELLDAACNFDVVVFATFPEHHVASMDLLLRQQCKNQKIVVLVHNPGELETPGNFVSLQLLNGSDSHVLSLAPHTVAGTAAVLAQHSVMRPVSLFIPVFPINTDCTPGSAGCTEPNAELPTGFVLQGLFQSHRRNYGRTFSDIEDNLELLNDERFSLKLIGKGEVIIPPTLQNKVFKLNDLPYLEYYRTVQMSLGVLTAFASDMYYTKKSSSSVAAAVVCGTPLIGPRRLLDTYAYLNEDAMYIVEEGQGDAAAMAEAMRLSPEDQAKKAAAMQQIREDSYKANDEIVTKVMQGKV